MSHLMADMFTTANLYKVNLLTVMTWEARKGRAGINDVKDSLRDLSLWIVNAQAGRIPEGEVFPEWYRVTVQASELWDAWYAVQKQAEWDAIAQWRDSLNMSGELV